MLPKEIKISQFKNFKSSSADLTLTLFDELRNIKNEKYALIVEKCRQALACNDEKSFTDHKYSLPAVTFSGIFQNSRRVNNILIYNNLIVIDIDKLEPQNLSSISVTLKNCPLIFALWLSPSGRGLKGLIRINGSPDRHKIIFTSLTEYFKREYNIELDKSGSDLTRLCFTSSDPHLFYNKDATVYEIHSNVETNKTCKIFYPKISSISINDGELYKKAELVIKYLETEKKSITQSYTNWRNVAFAVSSSFESMYGRDLFLRLCRLDGIKHNENESAQLIENCYKNKLYYGDKVTFKTIEYLASLQGYKKGIKYFL